MKTNKHQTLLLVSRQRGVHSRDIVKHFGYSPGTARSYLSHLGRQGLLERTAAHYGLTAKGQNRLEYFEVSGCPDVSCPLCKGKSGYLTCPSCGYQMPRRNARIRKEKDYFLAVRHSGVYCPGCLKLMFSEAQARLLEIREEE
jgi:hypothetical protein